VVEWGEGKVEDLSDARLQVVIGRTLGEERGHAEGTQATDGTEGAAAGPDAEPDAESDAEPGAEPADGDDTREVTVIGIGPRWAGQDLAPLVL
jgi:tRNA threonylcarbamoyladenosine biosynthesis protein TsaE